MKCHGKVNLINKNIQIGKNVILYPGVSFEGDGLIIIGDNVKIGTNTIVYAGKNGGVQIGENTIIAADSYIIDSNHGTSRNAIIASQQLESEKLIIGFDVWVGANVVIVKGAEIGNGVVIGANSFVNKKVEDYSVIAGVPAKMLRKRI